MCPPNRERSRHAPTYTSGSDHEVAEHPIFRVENLATKCDSEPWWAAEHRLISMGGGDWA
jgi:hypothetical protein